MRKLKIALMLSASIMVIAAGFVLVQAAPQSPPPAQNPPAQAPGAAKPNIEPQPPKPFPEGAKVAYIFMQGIFNSSADGKAAAAKLQEFEKRKLAEIQEKTKQAQTLQNKLQQGATVLNDQARGQGERDLQKLQRELQALREDAQQESQDLRQELLDDFSKRVNPIVEQVAKERGLHMVFSVGADTNIAWADPGLDITQEVVKRVDAAAKAGAKK